MVTDKLRTAVQPRLADLKRAALQRSLFPETTLARAIERLGFLQADPIRAPARAQDLVLRHRVRGYRAGDLERRYAALAVEEDFFVNYGFVSQAVQALMHPRERGVKRTPTQRRRSDELLAFVRAHGTVHPRDVDRHFAHGSVTNYWGGSSSATTHLLDDMHYRGLLRIAGRDNGIRLYAARDVVTADNDPQSRLDALVDVAVRLYAPVPRATLLWLVRRLRYAAPQWHASLPAALQRAKARLSHAHIGGTDWYWPAGEPLVPGGKPATSESRLRLMAPFDPVVWDRRRFEQLWGWAYRFEAYTPKSRRRFGYYALPVLWGNEVIGWGNLSVQDGALVADFGYVNSPPRDRRFATALDEECQRLATFLRL